MKQLTIICVFLFAVITANSQSIFYPLAPPQNVGKIGASEPLIRNDFRFITTVSATISDGTELNGGFGLAFERNAWDDAAKAYITKYFIAAIGFLGTDGTKITGTAGLVAGVPGTNGILGTGLGYNFTFMKTVLITGVFLKL